MELWNTKNGTLSFADEVSLDEVSLDWQIFIQIYLVLFLWIEPLDHVVGGFLSFLFLENGEEVSN
jgi:hypothetical protein